MLTSDNKCNGVTTSKIHTFTKIKNGDQTAFETVYFS